MARTQLGSQQTLTAAIEPGLYMRGRGLGQVALNLMVNSIQSIDASGTVHVEARREGDGLTLSIHGVGIPPDVVARLFEPFFTTRAPGLGLGLAVVHGIVAAHAGSIDVKSTPGRGGRFPDQPPRRPRLIETARTLSRGLRSWTAPSASGRQARRRSPLLGCTTGRRRFPRASATVAGRFVGWPDKGTFLGAPPMTYDVRRAT